jgi:beta-lactamase superfamily II metal-dependent hydrolase
MKHLMKSLLALLLVGVMIFSVVACSKNKGEEPNTDEPSSVPETPEESAPTPEMYDLKQYKIVSSRGENVVLNAAISKLQNALSKKGLNISAVTDDETETDYEILIGSTNRASSADALTKLESEKGYVIAFYDKKIVINSNENDAWEQAVQYFADHYVKDVVNYVANAEQGDSFMAVRRDLAKNGNFLYNLVVGRSASEKVKESVATLKTKLQSLTGLSVTQTTDASYQSETAEIVIGETTYAESISAREDLRINQYGVRIKGSKIAVLGYHDVTTLLAIENLNDLLDQAKGTEGNLYIYLPFNGCDTYSNWLGDIPLFEYGKYVGVYECANNNIQVLYSNVDKSELETYANSLREYGFEIQEESMVGKNRSFTLTGEKGLVHLTYLDYDKSLRVVTDPLTETVYKDSEPEYTKVTENTLAVSTLNYTHREVTDGNGMGYVITLEDGRFIIIDGGYADQKNGESDATILYNFLKDNNKRPDGKIVIAAWIFSHSHGDHYGAFQSFTARYAKQAQVQYFIYNTYSSSMYPDFNTFLEQTLPTYIPQYYTGAKIIKPHTGQVLKFCNVEFEVMYTHEIFPANTMKWLNDASLVLRMNVNGQKVLFTGDCEAESSGLMVQMYGKELKSDILQINHHGYSGGTVELYNCVKPKYTMWTTSQQAFDRRVTGTKYDYVSDQAVASNKHAYDMVGKANCFVADGPVEIIHFPLQDKLLDIEYYTPKK